MSRTTAKCSRLVLLPAVTCMSCALVACRGIPEEHLVEVREGAFKIDVRSREFHHSGTVNVDICVTNVSDPLVPEGKPQCFFHGYDLDGLTTEWLSERVILVRFECGRVSEFSNYALVVNDLPFPAEFHAVLDETGCKSF